MNTEIVKFFTKEIFRKEEFAAMLRDKMNVEAIAVDDGVILDRGKFNAYSPAHMPHWAYLNKEAINNPLHTIKLKDFEF